MAKIKNPPGKPGDLFWKAVALIGTLASLSSLALDLLK